LTGALSAKDESGNSISTDVFAVLISYGPNGHGAFTTAGTRKNSGSTNAAEGVNCMCSFNSGEISDTSPSTLSIQIGRSLASSSSALSANYDDIATYFPRQFFYKYSEKIK
jgi:hypothetical protein